MSSVALCAERMHEKERYIVAQTMGGRATCRFGLASGMDVISDFKRRGPLFSASPTLFYARSYVSHEYTSAITCKLQQLAVFNTNRTCYESPCRMPQACITNSSVIVRIECHLRPLSITIGFNGCESVPTTLSCLDVRSLNDPKPPSATRHERQ